MLTFPEGFIWGAATSSYQIEGSPLSDGAGPSIWHRFAHTPGNVLNGDTGDVASDHYRRHAEDVALMKEMGLKAYRLSVSWSRVFPEGKGRINERGLDFYDRLVDSLMEAGITPLVTIYHWDLPGALQDLGGWTNRDIADWFAQYAMALYLRLGDRVAHWITLNEPWVTMNAGHIDGRHAPGMRDTFAGLKTARSLMLAHGRAVQAYRACGGKGDIGITLNMDRYHPATSSDEDRACAERSNAYIDRLFLDPIFKGSYPEELAEWFGDAWPAFDNEDLAVISTPIDFLGVNYYTRFLNADTAPDANLQDICAHIHGLIERAGIDHVGLGADYDGIDHAPEGAKDPSCFPDLHKSLREAGLDNATCGQILYGNFRRVFGAVVG